MYMTCTYIIVLHIHVYKLYVYSYNSEHPPVILISIDGFRPDYLQRNQTPTLQRLHDMGVAPDYLRSVYPTITFPNHYTISTV